MGRTHALASLLCAALVIGMTQAPAAAAIKSRADAIGDARPAIDLTRVRVRNADDRITITVRVRNLRAAGRFTVGYWSSNIEDSDYEFEGAQLQIRRRADGTLRKAYFYLGGDAIYDRRKCPGMRVRWNAAKDFIRASIPQACYTAHAVPNSWVFEASSSLFASSDEGPSFTVRRG
jgi:hypothetical protein